jgi:hypothetical protein
MDDRTKSVTEEPVADHRTQEIRAEIEQTRGDMSETIDAIQERLRPGKIVADARERVRDATTQKVRQMAFRASDAANRQNLLPAALIGIGTAWLLMNRSGNSSHSYDRLDYDDPSRPWRNTEYSTADDHYRAVGTRGSESTGGSADVSGISGRVTERASQVTERAGELAENARTAVRQTSRRAQNQLQRAIHENPLAVGAAAAILGAAIGLALPETERENEWMGDARDNVLDKAQELARNAKEKAKNIAGDAVGDALTGAKND